METKSPSSHRPLDAGEGAEAGAQRLQLVVDVLVADLDRVDRDLERAQVGQRDLGADVDLGGEHQLLAVLDLGDLDVGLTERLHLGGGHGLAVAGGQRVVDDLLEHGAAADAGLEQLGAAPCPDGSRAAGPAARAPCRRGRSRASARSKGTSTLMRTRVGLNFSTVLFTDVLLDRLWSVVVVRVRAGRGDRI